MKPIKHISVTYEDGEIEYLPQSIVYNISKLSKIYDTFTSFIDSITHSWDVRYQLNELSNKHKVELDNIRNKHSIEKDRLREDYNNRLIEQQEKQKAKKKISLNIQRGNLQGHSLEKLLPCLKEFPYSSGDIIGVYDTFDLLVLEGRSNNNITGIKFQEIKTGTSQLNDTQVALKRFIDGVNNPNVKMDIWTRKDSDSVFKLNTNTSYIDNDIIPFHPRNAIDVIRNLL